MHRMNLQTFAERFQAGEFEDRSLRTQIDAGWHDWFCDDDELPEKTQRLGKLALDLIESDRIDPENTYLFFKNNLRADGILYDDFRIADSKTGYIAYAVVPENPDRTGSEVWGLSNGFKGPLVEGSWSEVRKFFGVDPDLAPMPEIEPARNMDDDSDLRW